METSVCKTLSARMSTVQDAGVQRARICALEDLWVNCPRLLLARAWVPWPSTRLWARWQQRDGHASATRVVARPPLAAHGQGYEARSRMPKPKEGAPVEAGWSRPLQPCDDAANGWERGLCVESCAFRAAMEVGRLCT